MLSGHAAYMLSPPLVKVRALAELPLTFLKRGRGAPYLTSLTDTLLYAVKIATNGPDPMAARKNLKLNTGRASGSSPNSKPDSSLIRSLLLRQGGGRPPARDRVKTSFCINRIRHNAPCPVNLTRRDARTSCRARALRAYSVRFKRAGCEESRVPVYLRLAARLACGAAA